MEANDSELDLEIMAEFNAYVNEFINSSKLDIVNYDDQVNEILTATAQQIQDLTSEECLSYSYKLSSFCLFVRKELSLNLVRLNWCEDSLNRILAQEYNNFDPYMKYELRRQAICIDNQFAFRIEKLRSRLKARAILMEDRVRDIRDMANTLLELGKRKGYNEK